MSALATALKLARLQGKAEGDAATRGNRRRPLDGTSNGPLNGTSNTKPRAIRAGLFDAAGLVWPAVQTRGPFSAPAGLTSMSATAHKQAPSSRRRRAQIIHRPDEAQENFSGPMPHAARDRRGVTATRTRAVARPLAEDKGNRDWLRKERWAATGSGMVAGLCG